MLIRRMRNQVLISFNVEDEAIGFFKFLKKGVKDASFIELVNHVGDDGTCDKHRMGWLGSAFPFGCPSCNIELYRTMGFTVIKESGRWNVKPQGK
ncbi:MAG: hypothetical protein K5790_10135 [Nitrosopumilus sp.]|uniref:hypothetical protein n=1 Tax=Nitrosopumilus sp. TaxID=2024843 RepID=UPI00247ED790|nr:hypothetical protein [Nitrosopumilus sp.]MCV0393627.1 hypothetical protein [Nitrosopumilus sp.]